MASNFGNLVINVTVHDGNKYVVTFVMTQTNQGVGDFNKSISGTNQTISIHSDTLTSTIILYVHGFSYMIPVNDLVALRINNTTYMCLQCAWQPCMCPLT
jgi:hypothetical protein